MQGLWEEYATKFILGKLNPANDSDWNEYLATLKKVGFDKELAIRQEVFGKSAVY
jgi:putative aldouronate transport system substrate-binding protein